VRNARASNGGRSFAFRYIANILIPLERQLIALQSAADSFYIVKLCSRLLVLYCRNCPKDDRFRYLIPILRKLGRRRTLVDNSLESPCRLLIKCNYGRRM